MSTASLFPQQQKSRFMSITLSRYTHLCERLEKKHLPRPPFTLAQLRDRVYDAMGERYDGAFRCPYCRRVCDLSEIEFDHAVPIERGGPLTLDNIEFPCATCNAVKGEATSEEMRKLMIFLYEVIPFARETFYSRLAMFSKLMAGKRKAEMLLRNNGQMPAKKPKPGKPPLIEEIDGNF